MDIVQLIRDNKLIYMTIDKLVDSISTLTGESIDDIKQHINILIHDGVLYLDDSGKISISADRGLFKARISVNRKGYGFAAVEGYTDFFIPSFALKGAMDGDDALVEITNHKSMEEIEGAVVRVIKRNTTHIVGTYIEGKSKNVVFPDDESFPQIRIYKNDSGHARNNEKVWVELDMDSIDTGILRGKIIEVLGVANTPKAEQLSIIRSYNLKDKFDDETLKCVAAINQEVDIKNFKKRHNFTDQRVITIDGEDARDFDDAIAVERHEGGGYTLYVHIADVSNYVVENSALDKEALRRGTSVYFPNQVIPMLPKELSNGVCSLQEGVNRLTLSVTIDLDQKCNVLSSKIEEGVIKSHHRMTYTEVMNMLEGDEFLIDKYQDVYDDILAYQEISNKLKERRRARGEIRMNLPEPFILENAHGDIISIENRVQDEAHEIIESLMVLCNECVGKKFFDMHMPFVYRVHEKPDSEKVLHLSQMLKNMGVANQLAMDGGQPVAYQRIIDSIEGSPKERTLTKLILRTMMKARYAPTCLGHFGLASEFYCHFTSPIRRYPDLQIHRIIKHYLHGVPMQDLKLKYAHIVETVSDRSSETEKNADEAEREVDDYKKALYMTKFLGEQFTGTISGVQEFGIFVELDNGVEGLVKLDSLPMDSYVYDNMSMSIHGDTHHYTIGDTVEVIVASANTHLRHIDFDLVGVEKHAGNFVKKKENTIKSSKTSTRRKSTQDHKKSTKRKRK